MLLTNATTWSDALATDCTDQPLGNGPNLPRLLASLEAVSWLS
jgi:hypothetical protein